MIGGRIAITVERLSKFYRLGTIGGATLREDLARGWAKLRGRPDPLLKIGETDHGNREGDQLWALRDVSLEVREGEVLGVIGRNGAGKSTLLKILSRITAPTSGRVVIQGRVGSLLEVGTGFHPDLTGRENIFLNGAILGMKRAEIIRKLDEIVEFAEMSRFIDTPAKRYSSGMTVRLAFSVAAHLEPEILIVDEVLAVGDAEFQKKCLGKMKDVAGHGRTVLFVSHNMASISRLCTKAVLLGNGTVAQVGPVEKVASAYLQLATSVTGNFPEPLSPNQPHIRSVEFLDGRTNLEAQPQTGKPLKIRVHYYSPDDIKDGSLVVQISSGAGDLVFFTSTRPDCDVPVEFAAGNGALDLVFDELLLSAGTYIIGAGMAIPNKQWLCWEPHGVTFDVAPGDVFDSGMAPTFERNRVALPHRWVLCQQAKESRLLVR